MNYLDWFSTLSRFASDVSGVLESLTPTHASLHSAISSALISVASPRSAASGQPQF
jgi:hypothetical protein